MIDRRYFCEILENIKEVFWIGRTDLSEIIYISRNYETIWGRSCESLYDDPKSWMDFIHPLDSERVRTAISQRNHAGHTLEYRIVRPDGSVRWISDRGFPIQKIDDPEYRIAGLAEDITDRKQAEELLRESEERYRTAIESCPDGVAMVRGRDIVFVNKRLLDMFGYQPSEKVEIEDVIHPDDLSNAYEYARKRRQGDASIPQKYAFRGIRKDGTIVFVEASLSKISYNGESASLFYFRDITERKKAEEALQEYEKLIENSRDLIAVMDRSYRYRLANETYLRYRGTKEKDFVGKTCSEVLGQEVFEQTVKGYLDRCFLGETVQYEMKHAYPGVGERDLLICYTPIMGSEGIDRVAIIIRDITQNKRYEETLRESEKRYRGLFETMPDGFASVGMDKRILESNIAFRSMLGYSHDDLFKMTYQDFTPEKWHVGEEHIMREQVLKRGYSDPYEKEYTRKDGTVAQVEARTHLLRKENGVPSEIWMFVRDVSKRKKVHAALHESEKRFRTYFELGLIGMAIALPTKGIAEVNEEICNILGYERNELLKMTWAELTHSEDLPLVVSYHNRVLEGEIDGYSIDKRLIRKDGRPVETTISTKCVRKPDGSIDYFIVLIQDITQRKQAEKALQKRERDLEKKSRELQEANVALRVLLRHREEDRTAQEDAVQTNVRDLVFPYLQKLRNTRLSDVQGAYVRAIESALNEITSPFLQKMAAVYSRFTPTEIQVANLIKDGKSSKEIGELLKISLPTVESHRHKIRKKLGLRHKNTNLQAYLQSL